MKIALLVSGGLGFKVMDFLKERNNITAVLTDKSSEAIISLAKQRDIPYFIGNPRKGKAENFTAHNEIDLLLSINYLFIIESDLIHWPKRGAVNFHGSLLPKYRGRTPHVWAIINNENKTGVTAHLISEGCDQGDIILQQEVAITAHDTGASVLDKFNSLYPKMVMQVIDMFDVGVVNGEVQDERMATYFGKRTPEDGAINWYWQKERIRNWVRAQAYPYPGAFTYADGHKVIIDKLEYDNYGFRDEQANGLILTMNPVRVKTPNGVVRLSKIRDGAEYIKLKSILNL